VICAQERLEMWAAETMQITKEKDSDGVLRQAHTTHSCDGWVYLQLPSAASYFLQCTLRRGEEKHTQRINHRAQQTPSFRTELSTNSYSRMML